MKLDFLGSALISVVTTLGIYIFAGFLLHSELGPLFQFQQLLTKYWTPFPLLKFVFMSILRPVLTLIAFLQMCRLFAIFISGGPIAAFLIQDNIANMDRISHRFWIHSYARETLHNHAIIQILLQWSSDVLHSMVALLQFSGLISVPLNYMTIMMYNTIPFRLYVIFPVACILLPLSHEIFLPILINVYEDEVNLHRKWRRSLCFCGDAKYLVRRVKATRILRVYCAVLEFNFYFLKNSTKLRYQYAILNYTISAVLSVKE